jgi:riboflavin synthase
MDKNLMLCLLENLSPGTSEVFLHRDENEHARELESLLSTKVRELIKQRQIEPNSYDN